MINFRSAIFGAAMTLLGLGSAQAALIDTGNTFIDEEAGLEWLELSQTDGMSYANALSAFSSDGWGYASRAQFSDIFYKVFPFYSPNVDGFQTTSNITVMSQGDLWVDLFGTTYLNGNQNVSFGWYKDDSGILRLGGINDTGTNITLYGNHQYNYGSYLGSGNSSVGVFLVRDYVVPAAVSSPMTLLLLGLGLAGLGFAGRKAKVAE